MTTITQKFLLHFSFLTGVIERRETNIKFILKARTNEEYAPSTFGCTRIIDSFSFIGKSLDALVENLTDECFSEKEKHWKSDSNLTNNK